MSGTDLNYLDNTETFSADQMEFENNQKLENNQNSENRDESSHPRDTYPLDQMRRSSAPDLKRKPSTSTINSANFAFVTWSGTDIGMGTTVSDSELDTEQDTDTENHHPLSNPNVSIITDLSSNETASVPIIKKIRKRNKHDANKHIKFRSNEEITSFEGVKIDGVTNQDHSDPVTFILSLVLILSSVCLFGLVGSLHYCNGSDQWWFLKNEYCNEFNARFLPK